MNRSKPYHDVSAFYENLRGGSVSNYQVGAMISEWSNEVTICPRNTNINASTTDQETLLNLTKVTTDDVVFWYKRDRAFFTHPGYIEWKFDFNPDFAPKHPKTYQFSRVDLTLTGRILENTRLALCLFCRYPCFYSLTGPLGILMHIEKMHPHEIPSFVRELMKELDLLSVPDFDLVSAPEVDSTLTLALPDMSDIPYPWQEFHYLEDGISNQLRFAPRSRISEHIVKSLDVSESLLVPWYHRNVNDFQKYRHRNVRYKCNPFFDPKKPEVAQIFRVMVDDDGNEILKSQQYLCLYCQVPQFRYLHSEVGLLAHIGGVHTSHEFPSVDAIRKIMGEDW